MEQLQERNIINNSGNTDTLMDKVLMKSMNYDKFSKFYNKFSSLKGMELIDKILEELNIQAVVDEQDFKHIPKNGGFVIVANHPFGILDNLLLLSVISKLRPDFKVMSSEVLEKDNTFSSFCLPVQSPSTEEEDMLSHIENGGGFGVFPAGEVSTFYQDQKGIKDKLWDKSIVKRVKKAGVPVIPVYFEGKNSVSFHLLGKLHPKLRDARIPAELFKKKNAKVRLRIGSAISVKEQKASDSAGDLSRYLRARVYILGSALNSKKLFKPSFKNFKKQKEIISPVPEIVLTQEVGYLRNSGYKIHQHGDIEVFIAPCAKMPNILTEIGRLREVTFRAIGEGTNKSIDLDEYDTYYDHLFLWQKEENKLIGSYRIGKGKDIAEKYGKHGFYVNTLFEINNKMMPLLENTIELGRSFIVQEYQQHPMPLFLLWRGILIYLLNNPSYQYLLGPVSISNAYSEVSKSYLISFIKKHFFNEELAKMFKAKKGFEVDFKDTDAEVLLKQSNDLLSMDKLIADIEPQRFRIPPLLKQYIKLNARIISFNTDPKFNDALDGLILLDLMEVPEKTMERLKREIGD